MKKILYLVLAAAALVFTACDNEQEDIFGESSANRVDAAILSNQEVLCGAENGWVMRYFPGDPSKWGGYNMLIKFEKDGSLAVSNELAASDTIVYSSYSVKQSGGVMLSFDTYNILFHVFSDPSAPLLGQEGTGMEGDYDFSILQATADKIILKGRSQGTYAELTPLPAGQSWEDYLEGIKAVHKSMESLSYTFAVNGKEYRAKTSNRCLQVTIPVEGSAVDEVKTFPFVYTDKGISFYSPATVDGVSINGFNNSDNLIFSDVDDKGVELRVNILPLNRIFTEYMWFCSYDKMGKFGQKSWMYFGQGLEKIGDNLYYAFMGFYKKRFGFHFASLAADGIMYAGGLNFEYTLIGENKVKMKFARSGYESGVWYHENAKMDYALLPFGYQDAKTFTISVDNQKLPRELILTDMVDRSNVITLSYSVAYFPFMVAEK